MSHSWIISGLLAYTGMLGLCMGLARHYQQVWQHAPRPGLLRSLRVGGWLALAASLGLSASFWGWAMGPVGWLGLVSLATLMLVLILPYAPRLSVTVAGVGWPLMAITTALSG